MIESPGDPDNLIVQLFHLLTSFSLIYPLIFLTKKRYPKVAQNITEYLDSSRDHQDIYIIIRFLHNGAFLINNLNYFTPVHIFIRQDRP